MPDPAFNYSRRDFIRTLLLVPASAILAACSRALETLAPSVPPASTTSAATQPGAATEASEAAAVATLPPTPACADDDEPTPQQAAGPFYTPNAPERSSLLEAGIEGTLLTVSGAVLSTDCQPVAGALLDFWHADNVGNYDNEGYRLRGHQFADENGRYELETIVPGSYPARTRHIHVRVQAPDGPILTTQLYFPGEPDNQSDGLFNPELLMNVVDEGDRQIARFDFVVQA